MIDNTANILEKLLDNKIDFAFISKKMNLSKFNYQPLFQDKISAYCSIEQKEKYKEITSITQLENETLLFREHGSHTRECVEEYFNKIQFTPSNIFELSTNEAIKQAILNNNGIGYLSSTTVRIELKHNLLFKLPFTEECQREFSIISPKGKHTSPIMLYIQLFFNEKHKKVFIESRKSNGTRN
ncbi:hypothetical protein H1D32_16320 [Anaerobacillus sp. CMMVII]|uniref:LysR substrate-binding domain-containing protein n=1 Tax=Anaerobacillus sp. CMMVII TaxID=2755588 RepID=UPI0021B771F9|nr:LysR substrate-binding domain-containing protein [Anaerobacillus sp. CMMVII]MCT8139130.1 hypothetical protein [Anaerobacillus sp. CMMVII]